MIPKPADSPLPQTLDQVTRALLMIALLELPLSHELLRLMRASHPLTRGLLPLAPVQHPLTSVDHPLTSVKHRLTRVLLRLTSV